MCERVALNIGRDWDALQRVCRVRTMLECVLQRPEATKVAAVEELLARLAHPERFPRSPEEEERRRATVAALAAEYQSISHQPLADVLNDPPERVRLWEQLAMSLPHDVDFRAYVRRAVRGRLRPGEADRLEQLIVAVAYRGYLETIARGTTWLANLPTYHGCWRVSWIHPLGYALDQNREPTRTLNELDGLPRTTGENGRRREQPMSSLTQGDADTEELLANNDTNRARRAKQDDPAITAENRELLRLALEVLTPEQRIIVDMRQQDYTWDEIAQHLGIPLRTAHYRYQTVLATMREFVQTQTDSNSEE